MSFLYTPIPPGTRIRSYDFQTGPSESSYLEGVVLQLDDSIISQPKYLLYCDYCNYIGRAGLEVKVPLFLDSHDFDGRIEILNTSRAQINLHVDMQYVVYLDVVWVFKRQGHEWHVFHQEEPDRYFHKLPFEANEPSIWTLFTIWVETQIGS